MFFVIVKNFDFFRILASVVKLDHLGALDVGIDVWGLEVIEIAEVGKIRVSRSKPQRWKSVGIIVTDQNVIHTKKNENLVVWTPNVEANI